MSQSDQLREAIERASDRFTPGPWRTGGDEWTGRVFSNTGEVAKAYGGSGHEQQANARLIAAAPSLLAALREARELLDRIGCQCKACLRAVHNADAALALAGGDY